MPSNTERPRNQAGSIEEPLLVVQARDAEIDLLKLLVQKLKLQLARRNRMVFGSSSERFVDPAQNPQGTLPACHPTGSISFE